MKVWVAIGGWNYEGFSKPMGIFSTQEKAKEVADASKGYGYVEVIEYEIDVLKGE